MLERDVDAVVVGAGTAGVNAALQLARRGLGVVLCERRAIGEGGARWSNGVLGWQFARAGVPAPTPTDPRGRGATVLTDPDGVHSVRLGSTPVVDADMRELNSQLVAAAIDSGVEVVEHVADVTAQVRYGRLRGVELVVERPGGPPSSLRLRTALAVDASGRHASLRRSSGMLQRWWSAPRPDELCSAAQFHFEVSDPAGARAFLDARGVQAGDTVTRLGADGGFSALAVTVGHDVDEVSVLTGTVATGEWGTGRDVLDRFLATQRWIGSPVFGGEGLIPLRRPHDRVTAPGLALVGDAAAQVFPAHGSGIGIGLIAGTMLAEAVAGRDDPGAEQTLWDYQCSFQRSFGGDLAAYDVLRRMNSAAGADGVRALLRSGVFTEQTALSGLEQRWAVPDLAASAASALRLAGEPSLARSMVPALARASVLRAWYRRYPSTADERALQRWSAVARSLAP